MKKILLLDENSSRELYDPLNLKIVRMLLQSEMSASEVSRRLSIPVVNGWRRLRRLERAGIVELRKLVKVGNLEKKIYGASALRYIPMDLLTIQPADPDLKIAYSLFVDFQRRLIEKQNSFHMDSQGKRSLLDFYIYTDLIAFVEVTQQADTLKLLEKIRMYLDRYKRGNLLGSA